MRIKLSNIFNNKYKFSCNTSSQHDCFGKKSIYKTNLKKSPFKKIQNSLNSIFFSFQKKFKHSKLQIMLKFKKIKFCIMLQFQKFALKPDPMRHQYILCCIFDLTFSTTMFGNDTFTWKHNLIYIEKGFKRRISDKLGILYMFIST